MRSDNELLQVAITNEERLIRWRRRYVLYKANTKVIQFQAARERYNKAKGVL